MKPYPQYGDITAIDGQARRQGALSVAADQAPEEFTARGLSLLLGYNYHFEKDQRFYNDVAQYQAGVHLDQFPGVPAALSIAGAWEIPLERGDPTSAESRLSSTRCSEAGISVRS
jgi:hypothetical protein